MSIFRSLVWLALGALLLSRAEAQQAGLRTVNVERFGVRVEVPAAWQLVDWAHNDRAFVLRLPQESGSLVGFVACELAVAPASLAEFQRRHEASNEQEQRREGGPRRRLIRNEMEPVEQVDADRPEGELPDSWLVSTWQYEGDERGVWFETRVRVIRHDTLYTFILSSDEAHFEAYRLDFEQMLREAKFSAPQTGVRRMPGGLWMQRDFRFALRLPDAWKPAFAPHDKALLFATGQTHEVFTDNLLVLAGPRKPLDLAALKESMAADLAQLDAQAEVARCEVVPHGPGSALESVIHTRRGPFTITVFERRFEAQRRNYEIRFTCLREYFEAHEEELRRTLDSLFEVADEEPQRLL